MASTSFSMRIVDRKVGPGHPCLIAAELSSNHAGSLDRAEQLIWAAKEAGADVVKFQTFTVAEILTLRGEGPAPAPWDGYTKQELYEEAQTPHAWFPDLIATCHRLGIPWMSSVFGLESLALLESLGCPAYKIARPEANCSWLIQATCRTGKPVFVSGLLYPHQGAYAIYCPGEYPCRREDLQLDALRDDWLFGLSCHCPDPMVGPVAVACGAHYLEAHLDLCDGTPTLDVSFNFSAAQFAEMVQLIRQAEAMM